VRPHFVVVEPPGLDLPPRVRRINEPVLIQTLVAELAVEAQPFSIGHPGVMKSSLHLVLGESLNRVQIPGILKPLLRRRTLRRAPGDLGQLQYTGPFPSSLVVEFDPG
jgi:hypothetical protein